MMFRFTNFIFIHFVENRKLSHSLDDTIKHHVKNGRTRQILLFWFDMRIWINDIENL